MSEKKSILKFVVGVLALVLAVAVSIDWVFSNYIIRAKDIANQNKIERLVASEDENEIPIFGSSKARSSFIPEEIHQHAYNYGMEKCNFDLVELLLEIELKKNRRTPIILEFNHRWFVHKPDHTINSSDLIPNQKIPEVAAFMERYDRGDLRFSIPGFRYFGSYMYYLRYYLKKDVGTKKYISKGGVFADLTPAPDVFDNYVKAWHNRKQQREDIIRRKNDVREVFTVSDKRALAALNQHLLFTYDTARVQRFEEMVAANPERDFLISYTPHHPCELAGMDNRSVLDELFAKWRATYPNLVVLNDSEMKLENDCFKNSTHLNFKGAKIYSQHYGNQYKHFLD